MGRSPVPRRAGHSTVASRRRGRRRAYELSGAQSFACRTSTHRPGCWSPRRRPAGAAQLLVPPGTPGVTFVALESLDISRRFSEVRFDGARCRPRRWSAAPGDCRRSLDRQLALAAVLTVAESVGAMDHEFEMTARVRQGPHRLRSADRFVPGREAPAGRHQPRARDEQGGRARPPAQRRARTTATARRRRAWPRRSSATAAIDLAQNCFQVFGGIGFTWEHDQHLYLRRITTDAALFGDAGVAPRAPLPVWPGSEEERRR